MTDERILARSPRNTPPAATSIHAQAQTALTSNTSRCANRTALRDARSLHKPLELPTIMRVGIAQHGARFKEIRDQGFQVENEMERSADGAVISRYWLRHDPELDGVRQ